jgi:hypothetical protein
LSRRALTCAGLTPLVALALMGCESTQDKAKKVQAANAPAVQADSVEFDVGKPSKDVKAGKSTLLHDQYGDAVVVELRNTGKQAAVNVPILVDVLDASGKSVFKNDQPGLDPTLNHVALIEPGETFDWVNDQIQASGKPASVKVTVGESNGEVPKQLPEIDLGAPKVETDVSGIKAAGPITNKSKLDQQQLVVFGVARQGGRVVAAGRALIKTLKASKPAHYNIFFIGDPKGAETKVAAPPTTLQ